MIDSTVLDIRAREIATEGKGEPELSLFLTPGEYAVWQGIQEGRTGCRVGIPRNAEACLPSRRWKEVLRLVTEARQANREERTLDETLDEFENLGLFRELTATTPGMRICAVTARMDAVKVHRIDRREQLIIYAHHKTAIHALADVREKRDLSRGRILRTIREICFRHEIDSVRPSSLYALFRQPNYQVLQADSRKGGYARPVPTFGRCQFVTNYEASRQTRESA